MLLPDVVLLPWRLTLGQKETASARRVAEAVMGTDPKGGQPLGSKLPWHILGVPSDDTSEARAILGNLLVQTAGKLEDPSW